MAMQEIVVRLPTDVLRDLDHQALQRKRKREQVVAELVKDSLRRERVREQVLAEFERKRQSPEWRKATKRLAEFRKHIKYVPEEELDAEIEEAVAAVRAQKAPITLSEDVVKAMDKLSGQYKDRSEFIELALRNYIALLIRKERNARDLEIINQRADRLNEEALEVLAYQVVG